MKKNGAENTLYYIDSDAYKDLYIDTNKNMKTSSEEEDDEMDEDLERGPTVYRAFKKKKGKGKKGNRTRKRTSMRDKFITTFYRLPRARIKEGKG